MTTTSMFGRWWAAPLLVGALALNACGNDDDAGATPAGEDTPATAAEAATSALETSETAAYEEFCTALDVYIQNAPGPDEEADPADFEPVVAAAPPEIADDMQDMLEAMVQISAFDLETASEEQGAEFEATIAAFDPLAAKMQTWATENCPDIEPG
jgi:hypothetical protein